MSGARTRVRLELESHPESVAMVRGVLIALAAAVPLDSELLDDAATAISEACNNVVLHAYDRGLGPLNVSFAIMPRGLEVIVTDHGGGLRHAKTANGSLGLGLSVISALADRAEFSKTEGGGTEVRMTFAEPGRRAQRDGAQSRSAAVSRL